MSLGSRIRARAAELRMSQSELARRARVPQSTINTLINGDARWSPHLVRIAAELETTPAFLIGEVDDPSLGAPPAQEFTADERAWVDYWRALDRDGREVCVRVVQKFLCGRVPEQAAKTLKHT